MRYMKYLFIMPMTQTERRAAVVADIIARTGIDETMIDRLVRAFYAKVREDTLLGPVFAARITDWEPHLQRMNAFWSSVALMSGRYHGQPMEKHLSLPVDARHFDRWLALFAETAGEVCLPAAAEHFIERAHRVAQSLELGIAGQNGVLLMKGERLQRSDAQVFLPNGRPRDSGIKHNGSRDMSSPIRAVLTGRTAPLGQHRVASGIFKRPLDGAVEVTRIGLAGDEQGDKKHHGGPEKAIHHYAFDHYAGWKSEAPELAEHLCREGAFGENISTEGLTEADVCVGDVYRLGTSLVQVSQARQPCWRLNERFGDASMARLVQETGRTGWYYRVLEEGRVGPGDMIDLLDRPAENWPLERILHVLCRDILDTDSLTLLVALAPLSGSWRALARRRLERGAVQDWSRRLNTPERAMP